MSETLLFQVRVKFRDLSPKQRRMILGTVEGEIQGLFYGWPEVEAVGEVRASKERRYKSKRRES